MDRLEYLEEVIESIEEQKEDYKSITDMVSNAVGQFYENGLDYDFVGGEMQMIFAGKRDVLNEAVHSAIYKLYDRDGEEAFVKISYLSVEGKDGKEIAQEMLFIEEVREREKDIEYKGKNETIIYYEVI